MGAPFNLLLCRDPELAHPTNPGVVMLRIDPKRDMTGPASSVRWYGAARFVRNGRVENEQDMILINPKRCCKLRGFTDQLETEKLVVEPHGLIKFVRVKNRFQYTVWSHRGRIVGKSTLAGLG